MKVYSNLRRCKSGIALVLTLAVLGILSLVVIGFLVSMRTEQITARSTTYVTMSRQLAHAALDDALEAMRISMPVLTTNLSSTYYVTQPGRSVFGFWNGPAPLVYNNHLDLLYPPSTVDSNDLNSDSVILPIVPTYFTVAPYNRAVTAGWIYVLANGSPGTTNVASSPLYGRYTFWVDDEGTKVNINTANRRQTSPVAAPHSFFAEGPGDVDLTSLPLPTGGTLTSVLATNSWTYGQTNGYFTTEQWQLAPGVTPPIYSNNIPNVTAYSLDDNLTPWGTIRTNLNSSVLVGAQGVATLAAVLNNGFLTNWFGMSLGQKYGNAQQIAANIIDYVNSNGVPTDSTTIGWNDPNPPSYLGLKSTPYIEQLHVTNTIVISDLGANMYNFAFTNETDVVLWNMYPSNYVTTADEILLFGRPTYTILTNGAVLFATNLNNYGTITIGPGLSIPAYSYITSSVIETLTVSINNPNLTNIGTTVAMAVPASVNTAIYRMNFGGTNGYRIDYAQIPLTAPGPVSPGILTNPPIPVAGSGSSVDGYGKWASCNDPRVKPMSSSVAGNWSPDVALMAGGFTNAAAYFTGFTNVNNNSIIWTNTFMSASGSNVTVLIAGDGDFTCHVLSLAANSLPGDSTYFGPVSQKGYIGSVGEFTAIHTGWPWRTFWLEPQPALEVASPRQIPDWIVLDLFSVTNGSVAGRINMNAAITNLTSGLGGKMGKRLAPLNILFNVLTTASFPKAFVEPVNPGPTIFGALNSPGGNLINQPPANFFSNVFNFVGQICEVNGFLDVSGTGGSSANGKQERERPVRVVSNLLSVRSSRFTVWGLAQAIQDVNGPSTGEGTYASGDSILAETKFQAVIERDPMFDSNGYSTNVTFRTVYFRYLTP